MMVMACRTGVRQGPAKRRPAGLAGGGAGPGDPARRDVLQERHERAAVSNRHLRQGCAPAFVLQPQQEAVRFALVDLHRGHRAGPCLDPALDRLQVRADIQQRAHQSGIRRIFNNMVDPR